MADGINATAYPLAASAVGDTPTLVLAPRGSGRVDAAIQNVGASACRVGGPGVDYDDPASGVLLPAAAEGAVPPAISWPYGGPLYAACAAGESTTLSGFDVY